VRLAVDLVNAGPGADGLARPEDLTAFLLAHRDPGPRQATRADVAAVREVRERLRSVFSAPDETTAARIINALLHESGAHPQLTAHDGQPWHLHVAPEDASIAARLAAEAAMGLAGAVLQGGFERLRLCAADDCADVFVDASRNRSRRYCAPETCGNRANVAAHRARRRAAG
jgi:predicted RNA-binding Zn ribbon-like protein